MVTARSVNRLLRHLDLEPREVHLLARMGLLVAVLLGAYTIAKVLRDSLFISQFGARSLPYGYVAVAVASIGLVKAETMLLRRLSRVDMVGINQLLAIGCAIGAALILPLETPWLAAAFYVWAGSQAMILVAHFWSLAADVWDARRARRAFPVLTGCGLAGGVAGGVLANVATPHVGLVGLLWILAAFLIVVRLLTAALASRRRFRSLAAEPKGMDSRLQVVVRSPLLRYLAASLALSVLISTLIDFQFKTMAQQMYPDRQALTRFLGAFHALLDGSAMLALFGAAGWVLRHAGIGVASMLQPTTVIAFSIWMIAAPIWWAVLALRWIHALVFQALGKPESEIYFMALRPSERRRVKPAIDVIVERAADAFVGVLLIVLLHLLGVDLRFLAGLTAVVAVIWVVVQVHLRREYTRKVRDTLAGTWGEAQLSAESLRLPAVRQQLVDVLKSDDEGHEGQVVTALELCRGGSYRDTNGAVVACLLRASPRVRAAAVRTMDALGIADRAGIIRSFLADEDGGLRHAAVDYLINRGPHPGRFAREVLEGGDRALQNHVLDLLAARPTLAPEVVSLEWVDRCLESDEPEDLVAAGRALGSIGTRGRVQRLHLLLRHHDLEARRAALRSAALGPARELLPAMVPLLFVAELRYEAREALAALGPAAIPTLKDLVEKSRDRPVREVAAHALARIGAAAIPVLVALVRGQNPENRHLGLRNLNRMRRALGRAVISRGLTHRMFLRELRDYRKNLDRALLLDGCQDPELHLLAESYRESADLALERAFRALGCWYEPAPLDGVYRSLRSGEREAASRALEYLAGILPRRLFRSVMTVFEARHDEDEVLVTTEIVAECVVHAWQEGDSWLRACAIRAARSLEGIDISTFARGEDDDPLVVEELQSLALAGPGNGLRRGEERSGDSAPLAKKPPC